MDRILERIKPFGKVKIDESMKQHTTYRIGGIVDYYIYPKNELALIRLLEILKEEAIPYYILGRGSNLLFHDSHFHGAIINLDQTLNEFYFEPNGLLIAQAGCSLINLAMEAMRHSLSGLEFASGIPGSVGGGLFMNAGAYNSNLSNILVKVLALKDGEIVWLDKEDLEYDYRHSLFQKHRDWTILAGCFQLIPKEQEEIRQLMNSRRSRRMQTQPLDQPCAGSVFRNPKEMPAWKIIDELGLRGKRIGDAMISEKHSNFIVNCGEAKAEDVHRLIECVQIRAKEKFGIDLIQEVEYLNWNEKEDEEKDAKS